MQKVCCSSCAHYLAVTAVFPVIVLCCRCACVCINVRVVVYGISRQCAHYRGGPGHPGWSAGGHSDRLSEEENSAASVLQPQKDHSGKTQVMPFRQKKNIPHYAIFIYRDLQGKYSCNFEYKFQT